MVVGFCAFYLFCTEYISAEKSKGEVLLFPRTKAPKIRAAKKDVEEASPNRVDSDMIAVQKTQTNVPANIQKQTAIFHWDGMNYDIKVCFNSQTVSAGPSPDIYFSLYCQ